MLSLITEAASELLGGLSMYGGEKSPYADYLKMASSYVDQYGQKHEIPGSAQPSGGKFQTSFYYTITRNFT